MKLQNLLLAVALLSGICSCQKKKDSVAPVVPPIDSVVHVDTTTHTDSFKGDFTVYYSEWGDLDFFIDTTFTVSLTVYVAYAYNDSVRMHDNRNSGGQFMFNTEWTRNNIGYYNTLVAFKQPKNDSGRYLAYTRYIHVTNDSLKFEYGKSPSDIGYKGGPYIATSGIFKGKKVN